MRNAKLTTLCLIGLLAALLVVPSNMATAKKKAGPVVVGTDPAGDFHGLDGDPQFAPLGDPLGADLTKATISMADSKTINFVLTLNQLQTVPEVVRYIWGVNVDGEYAEFDGKFTNYTRGACDPTSGACPPPRDPGQQPFMVRANCADAGTGNLTVCEETGIVQAAFDTAAGTITIPVPMDLINAKPGSKITQGTSSFSSQAGGNILAILSAFVSQSNWPGDSMFATKTFTVPK
jgi:hypothetical protein